MWCLRRFFVVCSGVLKEVFVVFQRGFGSVSGGLKEVLVVLLVLEGEQTG